MIFVFGMIFSLTILFFLDLLVIKLLFQDEIEAMKKRFVHRKIGLVYENE